MKTPNKKIRILLEIYRIKRINMRKFVQYVSLRRKKEPEIRQRNCGVQNELCENRPVHIAILAHN